MLPALLLATGCSDPPARRPDVILLVMDTVRADRTTLGGYHRPTTPGLSELAERSVVYRNAWSPSPWTGPAHATLFTGRHPEEHGFHENGRSFLAPEARTLAEAMREAGYYTAGVSCNPFVSAEFGFSQGFDDFASITENARTPYPTAGWAHDKALEFLAKSRRIGKPCFLFVNDMEAHLPYTPPPDLISRFVRDDPPPAVLQRAMGLFGGRAAVDHAYGDEPIPARDLAVISDLYDAELALLDREIADLADSLQGMGVLDDGVFVVTSDHGENLGDHGLIDHVFSLHASLLRVPLLVRAPGRIPEGAVVDEVVRLSDVAPTILDLAGCPPLPAGDGRSLLDGVEGRIARAFEGPSRLKPQILADRPELADWPRLLPHASVFDGRWHLIRREDDHVELYDLPADPREAKNLAREHPDVVERLLPMLP